MGLARDVMVNYGSALRKGAVVGGESSMTNQQQKHSGKKRISTRSSTSRLTTLPSPTNQYCSSMDGITPTRRQRVPKPIVRSLQRPVGVLGWRTLPGGTLLPHWHGGPCAVRQRQRQVRQSKRRAMIFARLVFARVGVLDDCYYDNYWYCNLIVAKARIKNITQLIRRLTILLQ